MHNAAVSYVARMFELLRYLTQAEVTGGQRDPSTDEAVC
jgi:hypothetical protein